MATLLAIAEWSTACRFVKSSQQSMKPPSSCDMGEAILSQAAHWCMRLQENTCTQEEKRAFKEWIQMDPRQLPNHQNTSKKLLTEVSTLQNGAHKM